MRWRGGSDAGRGAPRQLARELVAGELPGLRPCLRVTTETPTTTRAEEVCVVEYL